MPTVPPKGFTERTIMTEPDPETARLIDDEAERAEVTRDEPYPPGVVAERRNRPRASSRITPLMWSSSASRPR